MLNATMKPMTRIIEISSGFSTASPVLTRSALPISKASKLMTMPMMVEFRMTSFIASSMPMMLPPFLPVRCRCLCGSVFCFRGLFRFGRL